MEHLFAKRRDGFQTRLLKYLPYVFNDHFVLVLFVLLGFGLYQYRDLLSHLEELSPWFIYGGLALYGLVLLSLGRVATYLQQPDQHYLLVQEPALLKEVSQAKKRSLVLWNFLQALGWLLTLPIFRVLDQVWLFGLGLAGLSLGKYLVIAHKTRNWLTLTGLNWQSVISAEEERQQSILRFFSLFTSVKGLTSPIRPRPYLNGLLALLPQGQGRAYHHLFFRAFLRSGDYLGLYLRLNLLGFLALVTIDQPLIRVGLWLISQWLWLFQLLALYQHYDYQYLLGLAPVTVLEKGRALQAVLRGLGGLPLLLGLVLAADWTVAGGLLFGFGLINYAYLPYKMRQATKV